MKKQYTKKQITEAIAYWKKQLNERYGNEYGKMFDKPGPYIYVTQANPSFEKELRKVGYSATETLRVHLTRYNTAVPYEYRPFLQIFFNTQLSDQQCKKLEGEFMEMLNGHFTKGDGGIEFFEVDDAIVLVTADKFAARYNAQVHPY